MEVPRKPFRFFCLTCSKAYNHELICHGEKVVENASADYSPKQKTIIMNKPYLSSNNSNEQLNKTLENNLRVVHERQLPERIKQNVMLDKKLSGEVHDGKNQNEKIKDEPSNDYEKVEKTQTSSVDQKFKCRLFEFESDDKKAITTHVHEGKKHDGIKPKMSYEDIIAEAINNSSNGMLLISDIYKAISEKYRYPFYKSSTIFYKLFLSDIFVKVSNTKFWKLDEKKFIEFMKAKEQQTQDDFSNVENIDNKIKKPFRFFCLKCSKFYDGELICDGEKLDEEEKKTFVCDICDKCNAKFSNKKQKNSHKLDTHKKCSNLSDSMPDTEIKNSLDNKTSAVGKDMLDTDILPKLNTIWTDKEKQVFKAELLKMGNGIKYFIKIASFLPKKTKRDCKEYYYNSYKLQNLAIIPQLLSEKEQQKELKQNTDMIKLRDPFLEVEERESEKFLDTWSDLEKKKLHKEIVLRPEDCPDTSCKNELMDFHLQSPPDLKEISKTLGEKSIKNIIQFYYLTLPSAFNLKKLYCLCTRPHNRKLYGEMIGCDFCSNWFHQSCLNSYSYKEFQKAKKIQPWKCPRPSPYCVVKPINSATFILPLNPATLTNFCNFTVPLEFFKRKIINLHCVVCNKYFTSTKLKKDHDEKFHKEKNQEKVSQTCKFCKKYFISEKQMKRHITTAHSSDL